MASGEYVLPWGISSSCDTAHAQLAVNLACMVYQRLLAPCAYYQECPGLAALKLCASIAQLAVGVYD